MGPLVDEKKAKDLILQAEIRHYARLEASCAFLSMLTETTHIAMKHDQGNLVRELLQQQRKPTPQKEYVPSESAGDCPQSESTNPVGARRGVPGSADSAATGGRSVPPEYDDNDSSRARHGVPLQETNHIRKYRPRVRLLPFVVLTLKGIDLQMAAMSELQAMTHHLVEQGVDLRKEVYNRCITDIVRETLQELGVDLNQLSQADEHVIQMALQHIEKIIDDARCHLDNLPMRPGSSLDDFLPRAGPRQPQGP